MPGLVFEVLNEQKNQLEMARFERQREMEKPRIQTNTRQVWLGLCGGFLLSAVTITLPAVFNVPLLGLLSGAGVICLLLAIS
jgi:hypothetical protein